VSLLLKCFQLSLSKQTDKTIYRFSCDRFLYAVARKETRASSPITIIVFSFFHVVLALQLRAERSLRSYGDYFD
uniref:Uncharacterized protein n=1 Tax=Romanomermis culicivorax TaxID=13658 RepID=A0A915L1D3_ROMCU